MSDREEDDTREDAPENPEGVEPSEEESVEELDEVEAGKLRDLLKGALVESEQEPPPDSVFLKGVQRRLRERSGGKFYADGWSTAKHPPIGTYFITSFIMLLVIFAVYATLSSLNGESVDVENTPAPVRIVFPRK
jgi:hypothetical protein